MQWQGPVLSSALLALLAIKGISEPPPRFPLVVAVERLVLPAGDRGLTVTVDALGSTIELRGRSPHALAGRLRPNLGHICPTIEVERSTVVLRCKSKQIDASIVERGGKRFLDLVELRGLPYRSEDQRIDTFYDPEPLRLGSCPGTTPTVRGECLLAAGKMKEATIQFQLGLESPQATMAALRLGDLALSSGDGAAALRYYERAGTGGAFGKLAAIRLCELSGTCMDHYTHLFDATDLPGVVAPEVVLRSARVNAFMDNVETAVHLVGRLLTAPTARLDGACDHIGAALCHRIVLMALESPDEVDGLEAISTYLHLPRRAQGPLRVRLARAAAERALAMGAPLFAANVLTEAGGAVPPAELEEHLLRTIELYLLAEDRTRARVVLEYADVRLGRKHGGPRWTAVRRNTLLDEAGAKLEQQLHYEALSLEVARDVSAAMKTLVRSHTRKP